MSIHFDLVASVVKSRIWSNCVMIASPSLNTPSPAHDPNVPGLLSCHVTVCTGTTTTALPVPFAQVSGVPSPTVMSTRTAESAPLTGGPGGHPVCGRLQVADESLVSATSEMVKSEPPFESIFPTPQPVCVTDVV